MLPRSTNETKNKNHRTGIKVKLSFRRILCSIFLSNSVNDSSGVEDCEDRVGDLAEISATASFSADILKDTGWKSNTNTRKAEEVGVGESKKGNGNAG